MTDPNDKPLFDPALYHHLPPEDRPSSFISDYKDIQFTGDSVTITGADGVAVNFGSLGEFAEALRKELEQNYVPHRDKVAIDLAVGDIYTNEQFTEFIGALTRHAEVRQLTLDRLYDHGDSTHALSSAADKISKNYGASDAYASATSRDVNNALAAPPTTATQDTPLNTSTVTSPNGAVTVPATNTTVTVPTTDVTAPPSTSADGGQDISGD